MSLEAETGKKIESRIKVLHKGYINRSVHLCGEIKKLWGEMNEEKNKNEIFLGMREEEKVEMDRRVNELKIEVKALEEKEAILQAKYGDLLMKKDNLTHNASHKTISV
jgi:hypothetical protein